MLNFSQQQYVGKYRFKYKDRSQLNDLYKQQRVNKRGARFLLYTRNSRYTLA